MLFVFLFKQKTAYEMRISDWSSDVCSSDLKDQRIIVIGRNLIESGGGSDRRAFFVVYRPLDLALLDRCEGHLRAEIVQHVARAEEFVLQIGRASCRERVCQYGWISVVAVALKKKKI